GPGARAAEGRAAQHLPGDVLEGTVTVVVVELGGAEHVGDEHIGAAVVIVIHDGGIAAPAPALQTGFRRDFGKRPVAVVVVQDVPFLGAGPEVPTELAGIVVLARIVLVGPLGGVGDEEIEIAIVVIVEKESPLGMADVVQAGLLGGLLEGAVALVAVKEIAAPGAGDIQVLPTVVPGVGKDGGHADAVAHADAGLLRHVGEGAVLVVAVQGVAAKLVGEVDVVVAVAVEVGDGDAAAVVVQ